MAEIKAGFNDKILSIRVYARENQKAEVNIEQMGLKDERVSQRYETLAYATLQEIIDLRDELNKAIKEMTGL